MSKSSYLWSSLVRPLRPGLKSNVSDRLSCASRRASAYEHIKHCIAHSQWWSEVYFDHSLTAQCCYLEVELCLLENVEEAEDDYEKDRNLVILYNPANRDMSCCESIDITSSITATINHGPQSSAGSPTDLPPQHPHGSGMGLATTAPKKMVTARMTLVSWNFMVTIVART